MIIEVSIAGDEAPRQYMVQRDAGRLTVRRVAEGGNGEGDGERREREQQVDWRRPEDGVYSLIVDGRSYDIHIDEVGDDEELYDVHVLSRVVRVRAVDARRRRVEREASSGDGIVRITAPIPGRVVKILAPAGEEVARGDGIIVVEAMKMENELKAPRDGRVASIEVQEGQGVEGGALLATIE